MNPEGSFPHFRIDFRSLLPPGPVVEFPRLWQQLVERLPVVEPAVHHHVADAVGLSDAIVDLVSTGSTLRANHLVEVEQIMDISSRLVVNRAALKTKREKLQPIIEAFERAARSE